MLAYGSPASGEDEIAAVIARLPCRNRSRHQADTFCGKAANTAPGSWNPAHAEISREFSGHHFLDASGVSAFVPDERTALSVLKNRLFPPTR